LSDAQRSAAKVEGEAGEPPVTLAALVADVSRTIDSAMDQLRATSRDSLLDDRKVGRAGLPATVLGLVFHAAEHTTASRSVSDHDRARAEMRTAPIDCPQAREGGLDRGVSYDETCFRQTSVFFA
jgi:hypothetical protein